MLYIQAIIMLRYQEEDFEAITSIEAPNP